MTGALDGDGQLALMCGAGAGDAAGQNLSALGHIAAEPCDILVVDVLDLIDAETANLAAASVTHRSFSHDRVSFRYSVTVVSDERSKAICDTIGYSLTLGQ